MDKNRKTSNILNVLQYDENGHVVLPATLTIGENPHSSDNTSKIPSTSWIRTYVTGLSYLTGNQSITVSGDATGSGTTAITLTLANTAVTPGTYGSTTLVPVVTVDSKGRITSVTTAAISGSLTFTGDVTGTGTTGTSTGLTLAASGVTAGTYTKVTVDSKGRVTVGANASTTDISEGTNLYYTDARVGTYLTANSYATQSYVGTQIANLVASAPATLDTLNELSVALGNDPNFATSVATSIGTKQAQLNGTGFVKVVGTTVSYDNNTYLTSFTETDPTVPSHVKSITTTEKANWNTAYGWGNHASGGYLTGITSSQVTTALGYTPYNSTNPSGYITGITSSNVTTALGYTPYNSTNPSGYITGITSANVTTALGFTPYNATNPNGYITSSGNISGYAMSLNGYANQTLYTILDGPANGPVIKVRYDSATANRYIDIGSKDGNGVYSEGLKIYNGSTLTFTGYTVYHSGNLPTIPTNNNQLTNGAGYITSITSGNVTTALGYTPYNSTNPSGYITTSSLTWSNISGKPTALSSFTNDLGNYGSWITASGNTSGYAGYLPTSYIGGVQANPQTYFNNGVGVKVAMTGSWSTWSDTLWINGYSGGDVKQMCALHTLRNGTPRMAISVQAHDATTYGTYYEFITAYNIASQTVASAGNATTAGGLAVHTDRNNEVNKIVRTDASGYIQAGWINTLSGDNGTSAITRIYASDDGYIRYYTPANFRQVLDVPTRTGGSASGTWGISISGNAATATTAPSGTNRGDQIHGSSGVTPATSFGSMPSAMSGFTDNWGGGDLPSGMSHVHGIACRHFNNASNNWGWHMVGQYDQPGDLRVRWVNAGTWTGYYQLISSWNIGSQSVSYASTAGSAPANGGNSSTVGGYGVAVAGSANTIPTRNASGYLIPENWIQLNGHYGLYSGTNNAHFYPNNNSYGAWKIIGERNGWRGLHFGEGTGITLMMNEGEFGFHREAVGWVARFTSGRFYGACDNVYNLDYALGNTHYWTAVNYFQTNNGGQAVNNSNTAKLEAYSTGNNSAFMSFHKGGHYAINMGLDDDNVFRIGGWSASGNRLQMDMSGNLTMAGDVTAYSDARVKENVITVDNALIKVLALRGVYYNRTDSDDKKTKIGVIAQETLPIVPEVVNQDNDGMFNVSYGNLAGLFIEAIKEQQKEIEELKTIIYGLTR